MKSPFVDPDEARQFDESLVREIKRRRGNNYQEEKEVSINEKRAVGRKNIMSFVKELNFSLIFWSKILHALIEGKKP